VLEFKDFNPF